MVQLDHDGDGEDADFSVRDRDDNTLFNVSDSGAVTVSPTTRWQTLTHDGFNSWVPTRPWNRGDVSSFRGIFGTDAGESIVFAAPLHLPHNSEIVSMAAQVYDASPFDNITVTVFRRTVNSQSGRALVATVGTTNAEFPGEMLLDDASVQSSRAIIDNQNFGYFVRARIQDVPSAGSLSVSDVRFYSVRVEYETTSVLP